MATCGIGPMAVSLQRLSSPRLTTSQTVSVLFRRTTAVRWLSGVIATALARWPCRSSVISWHQSASFQDSRILSTASWPSGVNDTKR